MMSLEEQIQSFALSIIFGFLFMIVWTFINQIFGNKKKSILRLLLELSFFLYATYIYFFYLTILCDGIVNIFYFLGVLIGIYFFEKFYAPSMIVLYDKWIEKIKKKIISPITLFFFIKFGIMKSYLKKLFKKVKKHGKRKKVKKNAVEPKSSGDNSLAWTFIDSHDVHCEDSN